jgi:hypothetical protein
LKPLLLGQHPQALILNSIGRDVVFTEQGHDGRRRHELTTWQGGAPLAVVALI